MSGLKGKRVLIFQQRGWGKTVGRFLARKLYAEGARLAALTFKETTHELIVNQPDVEYERIVFGDAIEGNPRAYLAGDEYSLTDICEQLGIHSIWPLAYAVRLYVKSYGDKYYYGFKQNMSDERIIELVMAIYKNIRYFFEKFNPDIIVCPNFVALPHIMFNLYGLKRGIPMIALVDSKMPGRCIFVEGYQHDQGRFFDYLNALNNREFETPSREEARQYIQEFRDSFKTPIATDQNTIRGRETLTQRIKSRLRPYKEIVRWHISRPADVLKLGPTYEYRPPGIILRDHICSKRYKKFMDAYRYYPWEKLEKYVYFPLQFQPEETIDVRAPYFSNQIEIARLVAQSMPDDYTLAVKEHPAMVGKRPPSYIEKVARTVNVKLIDYRISTEKVLRKAALVVSPSSTTIAEAAFLRIPAIQLGDLGITLKLPNVTRHTDMTTLPGKIRETLAISLQTEEYEWRLQNFVAAVLDVGFDYNYVKAWERGVEDKETLWNIYKNEMERILAASRV